MRDNTLSETVGVALSLHFLFLPCLKFNRLPFFFLFLGGFLVSQVVAPPIIFLFIFFLWFSRKGLNERALCFNSR